MAGEKQIQLHLLVCEHKHCLDRGGRESYRELKRALKESDLRKRVMISKVGCLDQCERGPVMVLYPAGVWYGRVDREAAREIVESHLREGRIVARKVLFRLNWKPEIDFATGNEQRE